MLGRRVSAAKGFGKSTSIIRGFQEHPVGVHPRASNSLVLGAAYVLGLVGLGLGLSAGVIAAIVWNLTAKWQLIAFGFASGISAALVSALVATTSAKLVTAIYGKRNAVHELLESSPETRSGSEAA